MNVFSLRAVNPRVSCNECVKFEFGDIKSLYTKTILSEDMVSQLIILLIIFYNIIVIKLKLTILLFCFN